MAVIKQKHAATQRYHGEYVLQRQITNYASPLCGDVIASTLREIPVRDDESGPKGKLLSYRQ